MVWLAVGGSRPLRLMSCAEQPPLAAGVELGSYLSNLLTMNGKSASPSALAPVSGAHPSLREGPWRLRQSGDNGGSNALPDPPSRLGNYSGVSYIFTMA